MFPLWKTFNKFAAGHLKEQSECKQVEVEYRALKQEICHPCTLLVSSLSSLGKGPMTRSLLQTKLASPRANPKTSILMPCIAIILFLHGKLFKIICSLGKNTTKNFLIGNMKMKLCFPQSSWTLCLMLFASPIDPAMMFSWMMTILISLWMLLMSTDTVVWIHSSYMTSIRIGYNIVHSFSIGRTKEN
jgi:hypothetical protein